MQADGASPSPALGGVRGAVVSSICRAFRLVDFRGKARLFAVFPLPHSGSCTVRLPGGPQLRLDMSQEMERSYFFGLYDRMRMRLIMAMLADGGDFADVGANIGLLSATAALSLRRTGGRILAFEPNLRRPGSPSGELGAEQLPRC